MGGKDFMKKGGAYSKAVKIHEEEDFLSFLEWSNILMKYDKKKGLLITFPENAKNYTYIAIGSEILYICLQLGNEIRAYGSMR